MTSTKPKNVIELRQLLAQKFPGVRMAAGRPERLVKRWPTGVAPIDFQLEGGFPKGSLTEIISSGRRSGSALLLTAIIRQAHQNGHWIALIDAADSFDPASLPNDELARLLWVRCANPREALRAADLLLHDGTIPIIAFDLINCPLKPLRQTPSSTWHRLARTIESADSACVIFTPEPMISTAEARLELQPRFTLESLDAPQQTLLEQIVARVYSADLTAAQRKRFGTAQ